VQRNKENASKKKYHHTLGQGGYKLAILKWEKSKICFLEVLYLRPSIGLNIQGIGIMLMADA
jgi:hypothetical protein